MAAWIYLLCQPFAHGDSDFIPLIRMIFPDLNIQHSRLPKGPLVNDAIYHLISRLLAGFPPQQPEVVVVLQAPSLRFEPDARNVLLISHYCATVDELSRAVIDTLRFFEILGFVPRSERVPIELPLDPSRLKFPSDPADPTVHQQIQVQKSVRPAAAILLLLLDHRAVEPRINALFAEVFHVVDVEILGVANPKLHFLREPFHHLA